MWWHHLGLSWNGTALMRPVDLIPQETVVSDASGHWGCGAVCGREWFQLSWEQCERARQWSIMPKELLPIVVGAVVWRSRWSGKAVRVRCDNMTVVATLKSGSCKEPTAMHLRQCLAFVEAREQITLRAEHIKGVDNTVTDALSRNSLIWLGCACRT